MTFANAYVVAIEIPADPPNIVKSGLVIPPLPSQRHNEHIP
jgi:hypothetical protein